MTRVALATISLHQMPGGLEKNILYLANKLVDEGHIVKLLTLDMPGAQAFYPIDHRVEWIKLGRSKVHSGVSLKQLFGQLLRIRNSLRGSKERQWLVCFHHGILLRFFVGSLFTKTRLVSSERNSLSIYNYIQEKKINKNFLMMYLVDAVTVQFPEYKNDYPLLIRRKIHTVHNPVIPSHKASIKPRKNLILSIGRISAQKRFDLLIAACSQVFEKHQDWELRIIGNGEGQRDLDDLIEKLGVQDRVSISPPRLEFEDDLAEARFYCQPSQWEGFPNAMAEAMRAGTIPVGFASTGGVADLIKSVDAGYLATGDETAEVLASTLIYAIEDTVQHDTLSKRARTVVDLYSEESWFSAWQKVLRL